MSILLPRLAPEHHHRSIVTTQPRVASAIHVIISQHAATTICFRCVVVPLSMPHVCAGNAFDKDMLAILAVVLTVLAVTVLTTIFFVPTPAEDSTIPLFEEETIYQAAPVPPHGAHHVVTREVHLVKGDHRGPLSAQVLLHPDVPMTEVPHRVIEGHIGLNGHNIIPFASDLLFVTVYLLVEIPPDETVT
ncbi:hypothetical protein TELCIR_01670 [Teladorsagia circumcincta]|uniref:Uncharacterized protein n=1 Tax=Teladorsagia circumcincta TaxID=45464 RepID=A0A2G9V1J8_TELCI|nr:hypothetical protein TELCIR_01670 [Teladorsagia circumcincta]